MLKCYLFCPAPLCSDLREFLTRYLCPNNTSEVEEGTEWQKANTDTDGSLAGPNEESLII